MIAIPVAKFRLGRIVSTARALESLTQDDILIAIRRPVGRLGRDP